MIPLPVVLEWQKQAKIFQRKENIFKSKVPRKSKQVTMQTSIDANGFDAIVRIESITTGSERGVQEGGRAPPILIPRFITDKAIQLPGRYCPSI